jgi:CrcB protein
MISHFAAVGIGGAIGAMMRHAVGIVTLRTLGPNYPWGTLTVNVVGSMAMGALVAFLVAKGGTQGLRLFLGVGVLGGFTTFSAFSLDVFNMLERGQFAIAGLYVAVSVVGGIAALWAAQAAL